MRRATFLSAAALAVLLAAPAVSSAQFRPFFAVPVGGLGFGGGFGGYGGWGWPGYGGYGGYGGWGGPGYGGYGGYGGWGGPGYGGYGWGGGYPGWGGSTYGYVSSPVVTTSYYEIPNAGMPLTSLGGLPSRWNGVDLYGVGNTATSFNAYAKYGDAGNPQVPTPKSGTLPAANTPDLSADARAHVHVRLPAANGRVWFEGRLVPMTNGVGRFVSPPLESGSRYAYEVRARWTDANGRTHNEARSVTVRAGERVDVSFVPPGR